MEVNFSFDGVATTVTYTSPTGALASLAFSSEFGTGVGSYQFTAGELLLTGAQIGYDAWSFGGASSPTWGTGTASGVFASSATGDVFGIVSNGFLVPTGYDLVGGAPLNGSLTFQNTSLTALGFSLNAPASGSFTVAGTTVNWTSSVVPEPGTSALLVALVAVTLVGFNRPRRGPGAPSAS